MVQGWKKYLLFSVVVIVFGTLTYILVETVKAERTGFETKTLWDWMELLIIPAVLAGGAILLNRSERALERKTAEDRAKFERDLATDRQQEAALQTYFDHLSELLLKEKLRTTKKAAVHDIARTRTISIMRVLDTRRNNLVIQFLREAKLITDKNSILIKANMEGMNLQQLNLRGTNLHGSNLEGANLMRAKFMNSNLQDAELIRANLQNAELIGVNLIRARFMNSNLQDAELWGADLQGANLSRANLQGANLWRASLQGANLISTNLQGVNLADANLCKANLQGANLRGANLVDANLQGANLRGAQNTTEEQLAQANSLESVTMPDGTKHE
jgi:uncharacterized protein YjbI with pentapeptide repeats